jgi:hypothetical protein
MIAILVSRLICLRVMLLLFPFSFSAHAGTDGLSQDSGLPDSQAKTFSESLVEVSPNLTNLKGMMDDSDFFCRDTKKNVSSFEPLILLSRYLYYYNQTVTTSNKKNDPQICAIYFRERYARLLFEVPFENGKLVLNADQLEKQYAAQLRVLREMINGTLRGNNSIPEIQGSYRNAIYDLVRTIQEYWLTRFINYVYLERSRDFILRGVGGTALTLGTIAGLTYFMSPRYADIAAKAPRLLFNLGMLGRNVFSLVSVGASLGASFAAASNVPDQFALGIWPSPLSVFGQVKDQTTIEAENVERNMLLRDAYAIGGSVVGGYLGWHLLEIGAFRAGETKIIEALLEIVNKSGHLSKDAFLKMLSTLGMKATLRNATLLLNIIQDSEFMAFLGKGYQTLHGTATLGSLVITDVLIHYTTEWIREARQEDLVAEYKGLQLKFNTAIAAQKKNPKDEVLSKDVFESAKQMFEALRILVAHLMIPAYQRVVMFESAYSRQQTVPMICNIAGLDVSARDETSVNLFLRDLQQKEGDNYLLAAGVINEFEELLENTKLFYFNKFFKHKMALLKISFFFDEKFGLDVLAISSDQHLSEFGNGYVRVFEGEMATRLQIIGNRVKASIAEAKSAIGPIEVTNDTIFEYLAAKDYVNASIYSQCLKLEVTKAKPKLDWQGIPFESFELKRRRTSIFD